MKKEDKQSRPPRWKDYWSKKKTMPVLYLLSGIFILSGLAAYELIQPDQPPPSSDPAQTVSTTEETYMMPVTKEALAKTSFYDESAGKKEQEQALVVFNDTYYESTGIDYALENGQPFAVMAPLSGTVAEVTEDPFIGNYIEIDHGSGVVSSFQSVTNIQVEKGESVQQGEKLAEAGQSTFNASAGVHVHVEVMKNGEPLNPSSLYGKAVSEWR